jgi:nitrite reductase (NADH) large subunit
LKQLTGFSLLGLAVLGLVLSLRKRFERLRLGSFAAWRVVHVMLGLLALLVLGLHTGFRVGSNLNAWLMVDFLALAALGSVAGLVTAFEHRAGASRGKALRSRSTWLHIVVFWPLPVLLGFHVLKTYYF